MLYALGLFQDKGAEGKKEEKYNFSEDRFVMLSQYRQHQNPLHTVSPSSFWHVENLLCSVTQVHSFGLMLLEQV